MLCGTQAHPNPWRPAAPHGSAPAFNQPGVARQLQPPGCQLNSALGMAEPPPPRLTTLPPPQLQSMVADPRRRAQQPQPPPGLPPPRQQWLLHPPEPPSSVPQQQQQHFPRPPQPPPLPPPKPQQVPQPPGQRNPQPGPLAGFVTAAETNTGVPLRMIASRAGPAPWSHLSTVQHASSPRLPALAGQQQHSAPPPLPPWKNAPLPHVQQQAAAPLQPPPLAVQQQQGALIPPPAQQSAPRPPVQETALPLPRQLQGHSSTRPNSTAEPQTSLAVEAAAQPGISQQKAQPRWTTKTVMPALSYPPSPPAPVPRAQPGPRPQAPPAPHSPSPVQPQAHLRSESSPFGDLPPPSPPPQSPPPPLPQPPAPPPEADWAVDGSRPVVGAAAAESPPRRERSSPRYSPEQEAAVRAASGGAFSAIGSRCKAYANPHSSGLQLVRGLPGFAS